MSTHTEQMRAIRTNGMLLYIFFSQWMSWPLVNIDEEKKSFVKMKDKRDQEEITSFFYLLLHDDPLTNVQG